MSVRLFLAFSVVFLLPMMSAAEEKAADKAGRAILVLDASGSMWGQIEGRTKVEIARESVSQLMNAWNPDIELGLMAYGHRRKGDCADIEMVLPVAKQNPDAVVKAVNKLNAKGKTPLSAAVKKAAETLRYTQERATVILVSDGVETCNMDPCRLAEELEQAGVSFTAHVIGFGLKKEEAATLRCLAEGTGGMFIEAIDAASLTRALTTVEETVAAAPLAPKVPPASTLVAVLAEGSPPLTDREINWTFTAPEKGPDGKYEQIARHRHTNPRLRLESGTYRVEVKTGLVTRETTIDIDADKPAEHVIDLNAGQLALVGFTKEGGAQLEKNVRWLLNKGAAGQFANITHNNDPTPVYTVPAGTYRVILQSGHAQAAADIEVKAGDIIEQKVYLNAGHVQLKAVLDEGGPQIEKGLDWYLTREKPDAPGVFENVAHNNYFAPGFTLGAGKHRFVVTSGKLQKPFEVEIEPDKTIEKTVSLDAGQVTLVAVDAASGKPFDKVYWTITRPEPNAKGEYEYVTHNSYHTPGFTLGAGKYRVVIDIGGVQRIAMIDIVAGETKEVRIRIAP